MARTVHLIRHGQSEFNRVWDGEGRDPLVRDAPLSEVGHEQVRAAREAALTLESDVVPVEPGRHLANCEIAPAPLPLELR